MNSMHTQKVKISLKNTVKKKKVRLVNEFEEETNNWKIQDFEILQQMGRGKFGKVYAAVEKKTEFIVALKKMSKQEIQSNNFIEQIKSQIIIQSSLSHPNVLKIYGYFWNFDDIYLILEYAPGGELFGLLKKKTKMSESNVSVIIRQICQGLIYLHHKSIIHRDIKPQNILISGDHIKIADFGWSVYTEVRRQTLCGTLDYLAPEIVKGESHDRSLDVWQIGILTYELAVGYPPFQTPGYEETYEKILKDQVSFPLHVSYELRQFVRGLLQKNPSKRISLFEVLREPFLQMYIDNAFSVNE